MKLGQHKNAEETGDDGAGHVGVVCNDCGAVSLARTIEFAEGNLALLPCVINRPSPPPQPPVSSPVVEELKHEEVGWC